MPQSLFFFLPLWILPFDPFNLHHLFQITEIWSDLKILSLALFAYVFFFLFHFLKYLFRPGIESGSPELQGKLLTIGPPGKS